MKKNLIAALAALAAAGSASAQSETEAPAPGPTDIVNAAPQEDWVTIQAEDLLVMTLAPAADGSERKVVIQLLPAPISQGWVENIRTLARAEWYDGITVNRVQDNYVVQWGDPGHDNPESGETETKPLPEGLNVMDEVDYAIGDRSDFTRVLEDILQEWIAKRYAPEEPPTPSSATEEQIRAAFFGDQYAKLHNWYLGWPLAFDDGEGEGGDGDGAAWPIHCYGMHRAFGAQVEGELEIGGIVLRHEAKPGEVRPELSGHYHPKMRVKVRERHIARPCGVISRSYEGGDRMILPAFGAYTGGMDAGAPEILDALQPANAIDAVLPAKGKIVRFPLWREAA